MIINDLMPVGQLGRPNLVLNERKLVLNELNIRFKRKKTHLKRNMGSFKTSFWGIYVICVLSLYIAHLFLNRNIFPCLFCVRSVTSKYLTIACQYILHFTDDIFLWYLIIN